MVVTTHASFEFVDTDNSVFLQFLTILLLLPYVLCTVTVFRLRWSRGSMLAFSTQVCGFKRGRSRRNFKGEKILSMPSFERKVKPSVTCRRFAACKRSLMAWIETPCWQNYRTAFLAHSSTFSCWDLSRRCGRGGTWRRKWERLNGGKSNGKLPLRICPGCSVPEPYRSPDWALVPAQTSSRAEY